MRNIYVFQASEEVFIDLVKEKMEEDPDFFDDPEVILQFIKIGLDLFKFGSVSTNLSYFTFNYLSTMHIAYAVSIIQQSS